MENTSTSYMFALDPTNTLVHVSDAERNEQYKCPGCKEKMVPAKGNIRAHHFRHDKATCSYETYLHNAAKNAFYNAFNIAKANSLPIRLQLSRQVTCSNPKKAFIQDRPACSSMVEANYNLIDLFNYAELEKRDNRTGLTPDVLLFNTETHKYCYFEICVTHACSQDKIDSGIPIIEINIRDEEDIQFVKNLDFSIDDYRVTVHNFSVSSVTQDLCTKGKCQSGNDEYEIWALSTSGRLNQTIKLFSNLSVNVLSASNCWAINIDEEEKYRLIKQVTLSQDPKNMYSNCLKCIHAKSWLDGQVYCFIKSSEIGYGEAKQCKDYRVTL